MLLIVVLFIAQVKFRYIFEILSVFFVPVELSLRFWWPLPAAAPCKKDEKKLMNFLVKLFASVSASASASASLGNGSLNCKYVSFSFAYVKVCVVANNALFCILRDRTFANIATHSFASVR